MGEAEKITILPTVESSVVNQPESTDFSDIFDQLGALVNSDEFDLRSKIKNARKVDAKVKKEMLDYVDQALEVLESFKAGGFDTKLATEAADHFDLLQEMGEKYIPNFEKKLAKHNEKMKKIGDEELLSKERPLLRVVEKADINSEKAEIGSAVLENKKPKKKNMAENKNGGELFNGSLSDQLAQNGDRLKGIVVEKPEAAPKQKPERASAENQNTEKKSVESRELLEKKEEEIVKKLSAIYEEAFKGGKKETDVFVLTKPLKDDLHSLFKNLYKLKGLEEERKERGANEETARIVGEIRDQAWKKIKTEQEKAEAKKEKTKASLADIKNQADSLYKNYYEEIINKEKSPTKDEAELLSEIARELFVVWPTKNQKKRREEVSEFLVGLKKKYKAEKDKPNTEGPAEEVKKEKPKELEAKISEEEIRELAMRIKAWRIEGKRTGYTWKEIDKILANKGIAPGTLIADKFMEEWDFKKAKEILEAERKKEILPKPLKVEKKKEPRKAREAEKSESPEKVALNKLEQFMKRYNINSQEEWREFKKEYLS